MERVSRREIRSPEQRGPWAQPRGVVRQEEQPSAVDSGQTGQGIGDFPSAHPGSAGQQSVGHQLQAVVQYQRTDVQVLQEGREKQGKYLTRNSRNHPTAIAPH